MKIIKIGTRKSSLACRQAEIVAGYIENACEGYSARLVTLVTTGDKILDRKLDAIGGKGLFVKELDIALRNKVTDLSVHSLKDVPMEVPKDLPMIGFSAREDVRDVLVLPKGKSGYDYGAPIGCSSNRRALQLKELYSDAEVKNIRGNVLTRLEKLDGGEYGALVLAAAGLKGLGFPGASAGIFLRKRWFRRQVRGFSAYRAGPGRTIPFFRDSLTRRQGSALCASGHLWRT